MLLLVSGVVLRALGVFSFFAILTGYAWQYWMPPPPAPTTRSDVPFSNRVDNGNDNDDAWPNPTYMARADKTANLEVFANDPGSSVIPASMRNRPAILKERERLSAGDDVIGVARLNSVLSAEAFNRAAGVTIRWLNQRDLATGLFPHTMKASDRYFSYGDVGADLYPFLAIGSRFLVRSRYPEILDTLAAERRLGSGPPHDVLLDGLGPRPRTPEDQMLANVEYAKDGLLPLVELLGPDPWLGRMQEIVEGVVAAAPIPTSRGNIPSEEAEVNGSLLQVLARLSWQHGDPRQLEMGRRIAAVYLDDVLPLTGDIPPEQWDFRTNKTDEERTLHLGDHGDEIISGLIEWHRVEMQLNLPEQAAHRAAINRMLDKILTAGRSPAGLWFDGIRYPSGKVSDRTLNDNWGYLGQAYLDQAGLLRGPGGDPDDDARADRYEQATRETLRATADVRFHKWESGDMDGYADSLESALYLLRYLNEPAAVRWVDEQIGVFYGFQRESGAVTDENIDGNFIRTAMLYGRWLTQGARLEPWPSTASLGAATQGRCLQIHLHAAQAWSGSLLLDTPRHQQHLGLPLDYPRLNQWQEWWTVSPGQQYDVMLPDASNTVMSGDELAAGLPLTLEPGREYRVRVCSR
jgi:hypothetical protein